MPIVTVGIPVYNGAKYLRETLDDIGNQSLRDIEILVSDNASTDGTPEILSEYAGRDDRIVVTRQPHNIGPEANYTAVLEQARAPYFMWRAYDDLSDPRYIETLHALLSSRADCALAVPTVVRRSLDRAVTSTKTYPGGLRHLTPFDRIRQQLRSVQAGWFYGLYRTDHLRRAWAEANARYGYTWARDHLVLLPFVLNDRIAGTDAATFIQRETGLSEVAYKPDSAARQWDMARQFLRFSRKELAMCGLGSRERRALTLPIVRYTNGKTIKYRRIAARAVKDLLSPSIKRA